MSTSLTAGICTVLLVMAWIANLYLQVTESTTIENAITISTIALVFARGYNHIIILRQLSKGEDFRSHFSR